MIKIYQLPYYYSYQHAIVVPICACTITMLNPPQRQTFMATYKM